MILDALLGPARQLAADAFDDSWYDGRYDGFRGAQTSAGVRVDEYTAFNYSVCWAATRLLAGTAGWLPFNLHKRKPGGGAEVDYAHRVHKIIHDQPNDDMGAMMFRAQGVNQQVNWGNCFSEIRRAKGGMILGLEPRHASRIPRHNIKRENGTLVYYVNQPGGGGKPDRIEAKDMFHVPSWNSDDGIIGKGVVTAARESIGKAMGTHTRGAAALRNGGAPPLALKGGKFKNKDERAEYRREINEVHGGPENAGKWLLLPTDSEVEKLGFSLEDSQFIETMQFDIEEMSRWYGVPPHLVGHLLRATFNNIEELGVSFVKYSLIIWLKLWEQEVWRKLLTPDEQQTHYAKFNVDALERGNLANRTAAGVQKFFNGLWTLNQWAEQEDMNPITATAVVDGETVNLGDINFVQQAMIPLAQAAKGPAPEAAADGSETSIGEELAARMNAYGIGVRAGAITPQTDDEDQFRKEAGLPVMSADAKAAWKDDDGIRRPITLRDPNAPTTPFGQPQQPPEDKDDGLSARLSALEATTIASQRQLATAMLRDVFSRLLSVEIHNVKQVAQTANLFRQRLESLYAKHATTMERAIAEPLAILNGHAPKDVVAKHVAESLRQLDALCDCQAEELAGRVEACVGKWHEERQVAL